MNPSFQGTMLREAAETLARAPQGKVQGKVDRFRRRKDLKKWWQERADTRTFTLVLDDD